MRILFFGTYEADRHARVRVLIEGFRKQGDEVIECNAPLGLGTGDRVRLLRRPWRIGGFAIRLARRWLELARRARALPRPDVVVVGYMAHFDVHLARGLFPRTPVVLDHMIFAADTARDRGTRSRMLLWALGRVDRAAIRRADRVIVDTAEHRQLLPRSARSRSLVVPIGAPDLWRRDVGETGEDEPLRVVFFGTFTPLQGAVTVARAAALLADAPIDFRMYGRGQDYERARAAARANPGVRWGWIPSDELPDRVAECDVCLGIFGTGPKARRVVPNKMYQGAAAGCALVTSNTPPQRRAFENAAVFVAPGDPAALASALRELAGDRERVRRLRRAAAARAAEAFSPAPLVSELRERLATLVSPEAEGVAA